MKDRIMSDGTKCTVSSVPETASRAYPRRGPGALPFLALESKCFFEPFTKRGFKKVFRFWSVVCFPWDRVG